MKQQIDSQKKELDTCRQELYQEKVYTKNLEDKLLKLEAYSRRDNLIFLGIPESRGETSTDCE